MDQDLLARLRDKTLTEDDYDRLAGVVASGAGAIAIGGNVANSTVTTIVLNGESHNLPEDALDKLAASLRRLPAVHNNLPAPPALVGRAAEEEKAFAVLSERDGSPAAVALIGMGGVGKSVLAAKIAARATSLYPDAQWLIDLRGTAEKPTPPQEAMAGLIHAFYPEAPLPNDEAQVRAHYLGLLKTKKCLLLLDNASDPTQIAALLPPPPSAALVTSRRDLPLEQVCTIRLGDLDPAQATTLIRALIGDARALSDKEIARLVGLCKGLPLALKVAALYLKFRRGQGVEAYCDRIAKDREKLRLEGQPDSDVMAVLRESLTLLRQKRSDLADRWLSLCVFPAAFDSAAAAAVWADADGDRAAEDLNALDEFCLVEVKGENRFRLHDLLRDLANRQCPVAEAEQASLRFAGHFVGVLREAEKLYDAGGAEIARGLALFDIERANIFFGWFWAAARGKANDAAAQLAAGFSAAAGSVAELRMSARERAALTEASVHAAERVGNLQQLIQSWNKLGAAYLQMGRADDALAAFTQAFNRANDALAVHVDLPGLRLKTGALGNLGALYFERGETDKAIEHFDQALIGAKLSSDARTTGMTLNNLGAAYGRRAEGNTGEARKADLARSAAYLEDYLKIAANLGDWRGLGAAHGNLGNVYIDLGETAKAVDHLNNYVGIAADLGDKIGQGRAYSSLGFACLPKERAKARHYWSLARDAYAEAESPDAAKMADWIGSLDKGRGL